LSDADLRALERAARYESKVADFLLCLREGHVPFMPPSPPGSRGETFDAMSFDYTAAGVRVWTRLCSRCHTVYWGEEKIERAAPQDGFSHSPGSWPQVGQVPVAFNEEDRRIYMYTGRHETGPGGMLQAVSLPLDRPPMSRHEAHAIAIEHAAEAAETAAPGTGALLRQIAESIRLMDAAERAGRVGRADFPRMLTQDELAEAGLRIPDDE